MKIDIAFIKNQFQNIVETYHLRWTRESEYGIVLENDKIKISMSTDRYEDGVVIHITNKIQNEFYYVWDLDVKNGFPENEDKHLNEQEENYMLTIPDDDKLIYSFRIMLERYCQEALQGNFSKLGKGRPR
ncbi:MAG: hypothetical protein K1X55_16860 [Chitinophagales bacterium]|nr:hypothetical protein [Chitinophagales bacterium]